MRLVREQREGGNASTNECPTSGGCPGGAYGTLRGYPCCRKSSISCPSESVLEICRSTWKRKARNERRSASFEENPAGG
ncbi:hypothetical protein ALC57_01654 [Trachymyrmex cornetzi]|uniref:Uncharacterized protein n=1 Tax=Trachymyrmex cornetzi TaxID=471704 RepID=A0A195EM63_9HYME|nr:hypothetical protein ALC57_01654 [Trachymyrmex cornetzi]